LKSSIAFTILHCAGTDQKRFRNNSILNFDRQPQSTALTKGESQITVELSGKRSPRNSTPKYYNLDRSNAGLYIDRLTIILFIVANPLSKLGQKTDSLCSPNLELLSCALACVA
jgi:hypothetical protein